MRNARRALLCLAVAAALALGASAGAMSGKVRPSTGNGIEPVGSPAWPAVAAQLAKNLAKDSFAHDYPRVWRYLHPSYQKAVSEARWQSCQRLHPAAPPNVKITRVAIAQASQLPVDVGLLGRQNVQEIQLYVQYKLSGITQPQVAVLYTFWLKQGSTWSAVWLSDEYAAYKAGHCYEPPAGGTLY